MLGSLWLLALVPGHLLVGPSCRYPVMTAWQAELWSYRSNVNGSGIENLSISFKCGGRGRPRRETTQAVAPVPAPHLLKAQCSNTSARPPAIQQPLTV